MARVSLNPLFRMPSDANVVLNGRAKQYTCTEYTGCLSIKSVVRGKVHYEACGTQFCVDETSYLVLNSGTRYSMQISSNSEVETFCVFFEPGLVTDVLRNRAVTAAHLLDEPFSKSVVLFDPIEHMHPHDSLVTPVLNRLYGDVQNAETGDTEETLIHLMESLVRIHHRARHQIETVAAMRSATRSEIYRRLYHARDYIDACYMRPLTLEQVATVACMSRFHFLRTFKQLFAETPHQYLTRKRLDRADVLLSTSDMPVYQVAMEVGLQSTEAFIRLFRTRHGVSPNSYRSLTRRQQI